MLQHFKSVDVPDGLVGSKLQRPSTEEVYDVLSGSSMMESLTPRSPGQSTTCMAFQKNQAYPLLPAPILQHTRDKPAVGTFPWSPQQVLSHSATKIPHTPGRTCPEQESSTATGNEASLPASAIQETCAPCIKAPSLRVWRCHAEGCRDLHFQRRQRLAADREQASSSM
jgi:hypothetical protein